MAAAAAQVDFPELVGDLVLEPAGLADTYLGPPARVSPRIAYISGALAEGTPGAMYNSPYARSLAHAAFGVVATLRDLLAFGALFTPHAERPVLSGAGLRALVSDQTGGDLPGHQVVRPVGVIHPYGLGFMLKGRGSMPELVAPSSFGHSGASGSILWVAPVLDVVVAFVSNRHANADPDGFTIRLDRVVNTTTASLTRP